jgi:C4-dicarboxylate transporter DctM subunit
MSRRTITQMMASKPLSKAVWLGVLLTAILFAAKGYAAPVDAELAEDLAGGGGGGGASGGLMLLAALAAMIVLGSPLFVIIGVLAGMCFMVFGEGYDPSVCTTLDPQVICGFDIFPVKMANLTTKNVLLAIPFFVVSGAIMSAGDIANRLVAFARALVGFLPGGLAIATVGGCIFFAAISGSSPVTVIAIGSMMYPALTKAGYDARFSTGLVTTAGSLGILIPPSIPMLVFAIVAGGRTPLDVGELFMAGILPGLLIGALLSGYSVYIAKKSGQTDRTRFSLAEVGVKFREGFWAIMLPVLILGGIYSGLFTPTEAAAVSVIYALVVELAIHREINVYHLPKILSESAVMMGTLLIIMALAFGLNDFLVEEKVPDQAVAWIRSMDLSPLEFLFIINIFLLIVGALMDSISAIMIIAPLLKPVSDQLGIDPIHLGVVFIVNLEIGYLTPPIGINLFVASSVFEKSIGEVIKSVVPFILLMFVGLGLVTYVPSIAMGPVNVLLRDKPFYEPLPQDPREAAKERAANPDAPKVAKAGEVGKTGRKVRSMQEMTEISGAMLVLCDSAEEILDDEDVAAADRMTAYRALLVDEEVAHEEVLALAEVVETKTGAAGYEELLGLARELAANEAWECEPIARLMGADGAPADAPGEATTGAEPADEPEEDDDGAPKPRVIPPEGDDTD